MADWPSWRYGANGAAAVFASADEVPEGWYEHPSEVPDEPGNAEALEGINALREAYKAKFGKRPFNGWDEATLREKLSEE